MTDYTTLRRLAEACPKPGEDPDILNEWYAPDDLTERIGVPADRAYIAAASPAVTLGLLDALDAAEARIEAVREACADLEFQCDNGYADPYEVRPVIDYILEALDAEADQ